MSKILIYADPHICSTSSIIRGQGKGILSVRLESLISSFNWMNELAKTEGANAIICLGDLFDSPTLTPDVLTAVPDMNISDHIIILGNHDKYSATGAINSINIYDNAVISPSKIYTDEHADIWALPHGELIDLYEWASNNKIDPDRTIILSHNDIKGIYYGNYEMAYGYAIPDILKVCRLFMNGHIHTGRWLVKDRVINCGTMCGLNFNCQGAEWDPGVFILDTKNFSVTYHRNPYAYVFTQATLSDRRTMVDYFRKLSIDRNYCIQIRIPSELMDEARSFIQKYDCIKHSRILTLAKEDAKYDEVASDSVDDITESFRTESSVYSMLRNFVTDNIDTNKYDKNSVMHEIDLMESQG